MNKGFQILLFESRSLKDLQNEINTRLMSPTISEIFETKIQCSSDEYYLATILYKRLQIKNSKIIKYTITTYKRYSTNY